MYCSDVVVEVVGEFGCSEVDGALHIGGQVKDQKMGRCGVRARDDGGKKASPFSGRRVPRRRWRSW